MADRPVAKRGDKTPVARDAKPLIATVERMLVQLGEPPSRTGLKKTPERAAKALQFLTQGYRQDVRKILNGALYPIEDQEMVIVKDIDFFSMCEHHLLPFFGKCHVAYIPDRMVIGLSKIPRLAEVFSRRLQVQERLTSQIAHALEAAVRPLGVGVVMEAQHLCMMMRGVEKQNAVAMTSTMLGSFRLDARTRAEFLALIRR